MPAAVLITAASTRRRLTTTTCPRGLEAVLGAGTGFLGAYRSYDTSTHPPFAAPICVCQENIARPSSARSLSGLARSGGECIRCDDSLTPPKPLSLLGSTTPACWSRGGAPYGVDEEPDQDERRHAGGPEYGWACWLLMRSGRRTQPAAMPTSMSSRGFRESPVAVGREGP